MSGREWHHQATSSMGHWHGGINPCTCYRCAELATALAAAYAAGQTAGRVAMREEARAKADSYRSPSRWGEATATGTRTIWSTAAAQIIADAIAALPDVPDEREGT